MEFLQEFFQINRQIILFIYGLVFFILGLGIALQSRRYSQLDLARSLSWLAAFGFTHSLQEWGDLFIPIQGAYLSRAIINGLWSFQLLLLAGSFACLLQFGVDLLRPARRWYLAAPAVFGLWALVTFGIILPRAPDMQSGGYIANALARYFIAFPGGLLAAYGLRRQTYQRIAPLNLPRIFNTFRLAGLLLALYAFFGGLIPPPVPFFPGNLVNRVTFQAALGVPPLVVRSLIGLALAVVVIRALEVFEVETDRLIEAMEQQQILAAERLRLGRELHDGAIQTVYTAGLLVESARGLAPPDSPLAARLEKAVAVLNDAIRDLRHNLEELQAAPAGQPLAAALRQLAEDPRFFPLVEVKLDLKLPEADTLPAARTEHIRAIIGEALANVVRHAQARRVTLSAQREDGQLHISLVDDGEGLADDYHAGYGLRNMRDRARLLNGTLEISAARGRGTVVRLAIPWKDER